jgi:hypothetical protein
MNARVIYLPVFGAALSLAAIACQGSNLTLPADGFPSELRAVSGDGQQGTVGTQLPKPLVVRVRDAAARPLAEVVLRFETEIPSAQVEPAVIATDDSGLAAVHVRLGSTEGTQTVEALLADDASSDLKTTFALRALAAEEPDDDDEDGDDDGDGGNAGDDDRGNGQGNGGGRGRGHDDQDDDDDDDEDDDDD